MKLLGFLLFVLMLSTSVLAGPRERGANRGSGVSQSIANKSMMPGQVVKGLPFIGVPSIDTGAGKINCPCSCQCPDRITVVNGVRHCPTECLMGKDDGTVTNKGLD